MVRVSPPAWRSVVCGAACLLAGCAPAAVPAPGASAHRSSAAAGDPPAAASPSAGPQDTAAPRAEAPERTHHFGVMRPGVYGDHVFEVRNVGFAPLELKAGETSCKCTLAEVPPGGIPPGGVGQVRLEWHTGGQQGAFSHAALVHTNDPAQPYLEFEVEGAVAVQLGVTPEGLRLTGASPNSPGTGVLTVYSELWEKFDLSLAPSEPADLQARIEPAPPEALAPLRGVSGYVVHVAVPPRDERGDLGGWLRLQATPQGADAEAGSHTLEVPLGVRVHGPYSIYGADITDQGVVDLGTLNQGQGAVSRLVIRVRDAESADLQLERIEVAPAFVQARVTPLSPDRPGVYRLEIEVPRDAPECIYLAREQGRLTIHTRHPRIPKIELRLRFAVLGRPTP